MTPPSLHTVHRSNPKLHKTLTRRESFDDGSSGSGNRMSKDSGPEETEALAQEQYIFTNGSEVDGETRSGGRHDQEAVGSTAFGRAFAKIMKRKLTSSSLTDALGPVLDAHKQHMSMKGEEAEIDHKIKSESKKLKQAFREKGHVIPAVYLGTKDKELIKLATKGVVKLFNAVSKAQSIQQEATLLKDSELKEVAKQSKSTFLEALQGGNSSQLPTSRKQHIVGLMDSNKEGASGQEPGWAALHNTFMLGKSRLKDWDTRKDVETDLHGTESSDGGSP